MIWIAPEPPSAAPAREALLDCAFGPARWQKTAERLREGRLPAVGLSFAAFDDAAGAAKLVSTLRFWNVRLGNVEALLLGPVAVDGGQRGKGLGGRMIRRGLAAAAALGHRAVILVGDAPYYSRFGFAAEPAQRLRLPGPVDPRRFLALALVPEALVRAEGAVRPTGLLAGPARHERVA
ncbi:MAG: N-acetyltransferase [Rhodospirillales bacterium]|nr:N-acetyltransferase [Rhodospirillales bacterium]